MSYSFHEDMNGSIALKSILSSRRSSSWLFGRRKKSVRFTEPCSSTPSVKNNNIQQKWRKYVDQQFRTLKKHKRNRWLGRGKKRSRRQETFAHSGKNRSPSENRPGPSCMNGLEDSHDALPPFEFPPPDHKKRKKSQHPYSSTCKKRRHNSTKRTSNTENRENPQSETSQEKLPIQSDHGGVSNPPLTTQQQADSSVHLKKPPNAFLLFSKACRQEFRDLMVPAFESKVVAMVLGHVWRYLSKDERTVFYKEAEESRVIYEEKRRLSKKKIEEKERKAVRRPMNGFLFFCKEQRALLKRKRGRDQGRQVVRQLAQKWNRMKPREKREYITRAKEDCDRKSTKTHLQTMEMNGHESWHSFAIEDRNEDVLREGAEVSTSGCMSNTNSDSNQSQHNGTRLDQSAAGGAGPQVSQYQDDNSGQTSSLIQEASLTDTAGRVHETRSVEWDESLARRPVLRLTTKEEDTAECLRKLRAEDDNSENSSVQDGNRKSRCSARQKKKGRVPKVKKRHVAWKDEVQPWDVYNPVSSVLCDEDICPRIYGTEPRIRDDSWLRSGPLGCSAGAYGGCVHDPSRGARSCVSCLSLNSLKKRVETNFRSAELELANISSSVSSTLCGVFPHALYLDMISSSSEDDSSLNHILNSITLSDHENVNVSHLIAGNPGPYSCWRSCNPCCVSVQCHAKTKTPAFAKPAPHISRNSNTPRETNWKRNLGSNQQKTPRVKMKPQQQKAPLAEAKHQYIWNSGHPEKGSYLKIKSTKSQPPPRYAHVKLKPCMDGTESQQDNMSGQPDAEVSHSSVSSRSSMCLTCKEINEVFFRPAVFHNEPGDNGTKTQPSIFSKPNNEIGAVLDDHTDPTEQQIQELHQVSDCPLSSVVTVSNAMKNGDVETAHENHGLAMDAKPAVRESDYVQTHSSAPVTGSATVDVPAPPSGNTGSTSQQQTCSATGCASDIELELAFRDKARVSASNVSVSRLPEPVITSGMEIKSSPSVFMQRSRRPCFQRDLSYDSMEALNSSCGFSVSTGSVSKRPCVLDESRRGQPLPAAPQTQSVYNQTPEDLELNYCQAKRWL